MVFHFQCCLIPAAMCDASLTIRFRQFCIKGVHLQQVDVTAFVCLQNVLGEEGIGFKIAMGAFDKTRPPVSGGLFEWFHG